MSGKENNKQKAQGWPHLVAGGLAGCSAVLLLHPFDVIKTRLQVQDGMPGQLPMYKGTLDAVKTIVRTEGWRGLYAGLTPSIIGSTISWGAYLYLYEQIKAWHRDRQGIGSNNRGINNGSAADRLGATWNLLSAAQAGAMVCEGFRGYYKGFGPSLVLQTAHGAIQFAAYEELKHQAARAGQAPGTPDRTLASAEISAYGAVSKFLAAISTYPTQVIRSRLQQRSEGRSLVYNSTWQAVALTWQREGLGGFYKGLVPSLMRVMPQSAITLMVYEGVVQLIDNWDKQKPEQAKEFRTYLKELWGQFVVAAGLILAAAASMLSSALRVSDLAMQRSATSSMNESSLSNGRGHLLDHVATSLTSSSVRKINAERRAVIVASMWTASLVSATAAIVVALVMMGYLLSYPPTISGITLFWSDWGAKWAGMPAFATIIAAVIFYLALGVHVITLVVSFATSGPAIVYFIFTLFLVICFALFSVSLTKKYPFSSL
eukprot:gene3272-3549_t